MSSTDSHLLCTTCLGVEHVMEDLVDHTNCVHCARMGSGVLRAKYTESIAQASSLLEDDFADNEVPEEGEATQASPLSVLQAVLENPHLSQGADLNSNEFGSEDDGMSLAASGLSDQEMEYALESFILSAQFVLPSQTEEVGQESKLTSPYYILRISRLPNF